MNTTGSSSLSAYNNRTVTIKVTGLCHPGVIRTSDYTVKVPYNRMSQTIQQINSLGGKVAGIEMDAPTSSPKASAPKASAPKAVAPKVKQ